MRVQIRLYIIFLLSAISGSFFQCSTPDETENRLVAKDTIEKFNGIDIKGYSRDFQNLVQTGEGVFRGVTLGLSKEEVKKREESFSNSELQEFHPEHLDYMIDLGALENTDLSYHLNARGNVDKIEVNIYPNSKLSQDSLFGEFEDYFTRLYGKPSQINNEYLKWEEKENNLLVEMQKKGTQKIHDINITFSYLSGESAGVLYEPLPEGL